MDVQSRAEQTAQEINDHALKDIGYSVGGSAYLIGSAERIIYNAIQAALDEQAKSSSPIEQARDALVAAAVKLAEQLRKYEPLMNVEDLVDDEAEQSATIDMHMNAVLFCADVRAYLALLEPRP